MLLCGANCECACLNGARAFLPDNDNDNDTLREGQPTSAACPHLPGFFTGVLSRAKLLLHFSIFQLFDLCFLDAIINVSFNLLGVLQSLPELHDVGHFVVVQLHSVQVSRWLDWILWWVFSA